MFVARAPPLRALARAAAARVPDPPGEVGWEGGSEVPLVLMPAVVPLLQMLVVVSSSSISALVPILRLLAMVPLLLSLVVVLLLCVLVELALMQPNPGNAESAC